VKHAQTDPAIGQIIRDGDIDAILAKVYAKESGTGNMGWVAK
jgi:hypothetical protein